jgi:hypothetical protein
MVNSPTADSPSMPSEPRKPAACPPDCDLPENSKENLDAKLDHAIEETFPTSDPVSVSITKGGAIDYDQQNAVASANSANSSQAEQDTAEQLLDQVREALGDVAGSASGRPVKPTTRVSAMRAKPASAIQRLSVITKKAVAPSASM